MTGTRIDRLRAVSSHKTKLYINNVAVHAIGRVEQVWDNVLGAPDLAGNPFHVPLRYGAVDVPQVPTGRELQFGVYLFASNTEDIAEFHSIYKELAALVWSPRIPLTLKREIELPGDVIETTEMRVKYVSGLAPDKEQAGTGRLVLRFTSLDAYWYDTTATTVANSGNASIVVPGDAETRRITLTFNGGTNPVFTNTTENVSVTYTGTVGSTVVLDVEAFTALETATNVVGNVTHSGDVFWMRFAPGTNNFTITGGGTITITAKGAHL